MVAAAFPVSQDQLEPQDEDLRRLLRDAHSRRTAKTWDIPSFLRRQTTQRKPGAFSGKRPLSGVIFPAALGLFDPSYMEE